MKKSKKRKYKKPLLKMISIKDIGSNVADLFGTDRSESKSTMAEPCGCPEP